VDPDSGGTGTKAKIVEFKGKGFIGVKKIPVKQFIK